jgi:RHS repeat-associated protein
LDNLLGILLDLGGRMSRLWSSSSIPAFAHGLSPVLVLCSAALAAVLFPCPASGQVATGQQANGETAVPAPGVGHNDIHLLSESVNLATGTVSLSVQFPSRTGGRFPNPLIYNSLGTPPFHVGMSQYGIVDLERTFITPTNVPMATWSESSFIPPQSPLPDAPQQVQCSFATAFTFTDRFGVSHNLGLGVVAKDVNNTSNGNGPCLAGQTAIPFGTDGQVWAALASQSNTLTQVGLWNYTPPQVPFGPVGAFTVTDKDGVTYSFSGDCQFQWTPGLCVEYGNMEDRNGNYPGPSGIGDVGYVTPPTPPTTTVNYSLPSQRVVNSSAGPGAGCPTVTLSVTNQSVPAFQQLTMANGVPPYMFYYGNYNPTDSSVTNPYGLVNEVVYPSGGWVKYTWQMSSSYQDMGLFGTTTSNAPACGVRWQPPVLALRQVSFDGVHVAETQTFAYSTTWPSDWTSGDVNDWISKTTSVTTTDNIRNQSFLTVYTYSPMPAGPAAPMTWGSVAAQIPVEQQIQYYAGSTTSSSLLRTVTKSWFDQFDLKEQDTILENALTSKALYSYTTGFPVLLAEKDEYDYGQTTPTRKTKYQYPAVGVGPLGTPVPFGPSSVIVYNAAGSSVSETDYGYDESALTDPQNITQTSRHDRTYTISQTVRGNPTTVRKKCFVGSTSCTDSVTTLTYDVAGQVLTKTDPCGNAACSDMTGSNHKTIYTRADSYTHLVNSQNVTYPSSEATDDYVTSTTDALGHTYTFTYDYYSGELTSAKDPNNLTTNYIYNDPLRRPTETDFPDGGKTTISYTDAAPNPSATTCKKLNASQTACSTAWTDGLGHVVETKLSSDPSGPDYTITTYDGLGRAYQAYNPTRCVPPAIGQLPTSCSGETTFGYKTYVYDVLGRTRQVTDQDGQQVTTVYSGNQTTVTDEALHTRTSFTDALGRLTEVDEPVINGDGTSGTGTITLGGSEQSKQISYQCGPYPSNICYQTIYDWDTFSVTIKDQTISGPGCGGASADLSVCASNLAAAINANSSYATATISGTTITLTAKTSGPSSNYSLSAYVNWDTYDFTQASFTATSSGSSMTGGIGPGASYTYDTLNNLLTVTQKGGSSDSTKWRTRSFAYDSLSRLTSSTNPESNTNPSTGSLVPTTYVYDANGNVASKTDARGITTNYVYDVEGRLLQKSYQNDPNNTPTVNYTHDQTTCLAGQSSCFNIHHRTTSADSPGQEQWSHTVLPGQGSQTVESRTINGLTKTTKYNYDLAGNLTSLTYPSARVIAYAVDSAARLVSATDSATTYASAALYTPAGALCSLAYNGGAIIETNTYNSRLQPVEMQATTTGAPAPCATPAQTGNLLDLKYNFVDASGHNNGNVIGITNNRDATRSQVFAYDALNRLTTAGTGNTTGTNCWGEQFTYDPWANLTSLALAPGYSTSCASEPAFTYTINSANRVTSGGFQYDTAGNLTNGTRYGYNAESQMTTLPNANETYVYDGDGNRIEKLVSGSVTKIYWYGSGSTVLEETDGSGSTTNTNYSQYIFFGSARIARRDAAGNVFYYIEDHLGSSRVMVQAGQTTPCYDADFYPFGGEIAHTSTCSSNYKFEGKERDPETNLDDFGARFYNSGSQIAFAPFGRFLSADWSAVPVAVPYASLTNPQTLNLYAMVGDNPETFVDLDGHGGCHSDVYGPGEHGQVCGLGGVPGASAEQGAPVTASEMAVALAAIADAALRQMSAQGQSSTAGPALKGPFVADLKSPEIAPLLDPNHKPSDKDFIGPNNECVDLTKKFSGMGNFVDTSLWRAGPKVVDDKDIKPGTAIATFNTTGKNKGHYPKGDVPKNSGIYLGPGVNGSVWILDQWPARPQIGQKGNSPRERELLPNAPYASNNSNAYFVIMVAPR